MTPASGTAHTAATTDPAGTGSSPPIVAFYGDSYTIGIGASEASKRWSTILCQQRGWREFNPSVNGLGFIRNRTVFGRDDSARDQSSGDDVPGDLPDMIIGVDPAIVFVTMGLNDNFSFETRARDIRNQISVDFARLKRGIPSARFIVVEPFWYTDERPQSVDVIAGWVRDAARAIGADHIGGASRWIEGHPEWMADDGLHPNDDGYSAMAVRMDTELRRLGV
jgi:lysophospholipase L1-like esterase